MRSLVIPKSVTNLNIYRTKALKDLDLSEATSLTKVEFFDLPELTTIHWPEINNIQSIDIVVFKFNLVIKFTKTQSAI